jgi:hypothetical protein
LASALKLAAATKPATVPKPAVASKAASASETTAASKPASAPKTVAAPKAIAAAPKVASVKAITLTASRAATDDAPSKAAATGQKGASVTMKTGVLKIKAGAKRPASMEPSLAKTAKQSKAAKSSLFVPASAQKVAVPLSPAHGSDDNRVKFCSMLGVWSTSSSSSSDSSASESTRAPQPNPDTAIPSAIVVAGSELPMIPKISELDATQLEMELGRMDPDAPHGARGSAGMFLN